MRWMNESDIIFGNLSAGCMEETKDQGKETFVARLGLDPETAWKSSVMAEVRGGIRVRPHEPDHPRTPVSPD